MQNFLKELKNPGKFVIFTHGGSICSLTHELGLEDMISPGSFVVLKDKKNDKLEMIYKWENQY